MENLNELARLMLSEESGSYNASTGREYDVVRGSAMPRFQNRDAFRWFDELESQERPSMRRPDR